MAKKSFWSKAAHTVWSGLKWFAIHLFALLKWLVLAVWSVLKWLFRAGRKTAKAARVAHAESKRPSAHASFQPLSDVQSLQGDLSAFESSLYERKSAIGLILGARGTGKSALGMRILENVSAQTGRPVYAMGFDRLTLPKWMQSAESLESVKNGSFLLVDEGGITFSSRSSMSNANKLLSDLLLISRHKDMSVLFISQNSSNLEVNAIRQTDYLLLKPPSLLQLGFERKNIRDIYAEAKDPFASLAKIHRGLVYVYSDSYRGFAENGLPSFWNERVSKAFKNKGAKP
ncbi:hypothetical protein HY994_01425 [Candidatus Micrarchaeota archaeon]|nr:hypothetical protein [Candidatus Micrarchaeota archaeon]